MDKTELQMSTEKQRKSTGMSITTRKQLRPPILVAVSTALNWSNSSGNTRSQPGRRRTHGSEAVSPARRAQQTWGY